MSYGIPLCVHPAWVEWYEVHPEAGNVVPWAPGKVKEQPNDVWDWQVALFMNVRGYEVTRTEEFAVLVTDQRTGETDWQPGYRYNLPPDLIPYEEAPRYAMPGPGLVEMDPLRPDAPRYFRLSARAVAQNGIG